MTPPLPGGDQTPRTGTPPSLNEEFLLLPRCSPTPLARRYHCKLTHSASCSAFESPSSPSTVQVHHAGGKRADHEDIEGVTWTTPGWPPLGYPHAEYTPFHPPLYIDETPYSVTAGMGLQFHSQQIQYYSNVMSSNQSSVIDRGRNAHRADSPMFGSHFAAFGVPCDQMDRMKHSRSHSSDSSSFPTLAPMLCILNSAIGLGTNSIYKMMKLQNEKITKLQNNKISSICLIVTLYLLSPFGQHSCRSHLRYHMEDGPRSLGS